MSAARIRRRRASSLAIAGLGFVAVASGCAGSRHFASPVTIERAFAPYREARIARESLLEFMRKRTAVVIGGVESLRVNAADGRISPGMRLTSQVSYSIESPSFALSLGAGAAIAPDGYFLTAAHAVSLQPSHVLVEATGGVVAAPVRVVWSDSGADVALVHAAVAPDSWFEWMPDRPIPRGGPVVAFAHLLGGSAGAVEVRIDFEEIGPYEVVAIPHDAPLRSGFSGGPAIALDGSLIGILTSTGKDTLFKRRGWITRPSPEFVARLVEADRRSRRSTAGSAPPR